MTDIYEPKFDFLPGAHVPDSWNATVGCRLPADFVISRTRDNAIASRLISTGTGPHTTFVERTAAFIFLIGAWGKGVGEPKNGYEQFRMSTLKTSTTSSI